MGKRVLSEREPQKVLTKLNVLKGAFLGEWETGRANDHSSILIESGKFLF